MKKKDKKYIEKLEAYINQAEGRVKYALDRFDILVISLSSGGLVLCLGMYEKFPQLDKVFVNFAWSLFSVAIIVNLLSHITGYLANKLDISCTKIIIDEVKEIQPVDSHKKLDKAKKIYHNSTSVMNAISLISLIFAIGLLIIFVNTKNLQNMSDKDKNKGSEQNSGSNERINDRKSEQRGHINANKSEGKTTIVIKGQGAGDRPKRDTDK